MNLNKSDFRKYALKKLKTQKKAFYRNSTNKIIKKLKILIDKLAPKNILLYSPLKFESNINEIFKIASKKDIDIFVPFIEPEKDSFKMVKYRLPLKKSLFGTFESGNSTRKIDIVDLAIVPIVGIDRNGKRIGMGKGMYDRFFASLRKRPIIIFIQNLECLSPVTITDHYDIQADYYITPRVSIKIKGTNNYVIRDKFKLSNNRNSCFDSIKHFYDINHKADS